MMQRVEEKGLEEKWDVAVRRIKIHLVHQLNSLVEGESAVLLVPKNVVKKQFHCPNKYCTPLYKGCLRVVAAASAVVTDPNADVLDLGGLNLLDLVASAKGQTSASEQNAHDSTRAGRVNDVTPPPPFACARSSPQNLAGGALGLLEL